MRDSRQLKGYNYLIWIIKPDGGKDMVIFQSIKIWENGELQKIIDDGISNLRSLDSYHVLSYYNSLDVVLAPLFDYAYVISIISENGNSVKYNACINFREYEFSDILSKQVEDFEYAALEDFAGYCS